MEQEWGGLGMGNGKDESVSRLGKVLNEISCWVLTMLNGGTVQIYIHSQI
jgi:hypothetical protein